MTAAFERTGPEGLVVKRWPAPAPDPVHLLAARADGRPAILRSGRGDARLSRWSYGMLEPTGEVASWAAARAAMADWAAPASRRWPPFAGGAVGYLGYDLGWAHQPRPRPPRPDPLDLPGASLSLYDAVYARDEVTGDGWLIAQDHAEARARLERLERALAAPARAVPEGRAGALSPAVDRATHEARVREALGLIRDGEVYQVNLTYPLEGRYVGDPAAAFVRLVAGAPPPFAAYLDLGDGRAVVSASPECFVRFDPWDRTLSTYPIKGTRRRDPNPAQDDLLAAELVRDVKERAEHLMIVDLLRNDLGRLAAPGDVAVDGLCYVESFETVHHLTSRVVARLPETLPDGALLDAVFPGGSITGAPKLRAMEIIDALEGAPRGVYTGAIGYLAPDGAIGTSIAIRTAQVAQGELRFGVGGGIVADSVPANEWVETQVKARALTRALQG